MPTFITSYLVESAKNGDVTSLISPSFTPGNNELIIVKAATWDTATASGTPSGGSLTYTRQSTAQPGGFNCYATIFSAKITTSPGSMSVTLSPPAATCYHSMVVERWSNATLAATPATNAVISGSQGTTGVDTPTATITTTAANSMITWAGADDASKDPGTGGVNVVYRSGAVQEGIGDSHLNANSVQYYAYQSAPTLGSQTIGMSAPIGQTWVITGIEILDVPAMATVWLFKA